MERLRLISRFWPVALCAVFYLYLMVHAFTGRQGLLRWVDYQKETQRLDVKYEQLSQERAALERRAALMDGHHVDLDWLDHAARENLFYSHPKDITIWLDD
jgi:cell division protein FtsB